MAKDYANANKALKTYVHQMPRDPLGHDSLGVSYSELNDPLQAICSFVNAINLSPGYYMSYYNLGVVLGRLDLHEYALNVYRHCLTLYPNYVNALNNVADIFKKLG
jgi:protein O-GlcNAc transferase